MQSWILAVLKAIFQSTTTRRIAKMTTKKSHQPKSLKLGARANNQFNFVVLGLVGLMTLLAGCGSTPSTSPNTVAATTACTTSPIPTYSGSAAVILANNCSSCHHGTQFASYTGAFADANNIASQVSAGTMPQGYTLSANDKNTLVQWVACGSSK